MAVGSKLIVTAKLPTEYTSGAAATLRVRLSCHSSTRLFYL